MNGLSWLMRDVRYAIRGLLRDRGTVALAVLALSLGIGAATIIFSVVYSILINPSAYRDPGRIVHFYVQTPERPFRSAWYPAPEFAAYREQNDVFSHVLGGTSLEVLYTVGETATYRARGAYMDPGALAGLGVSPILGRALTDADAEPAAPPTFLMTDRMWNERFGRDPGVIGMTLRMNGTMRTLIGVLPPRVLLHNADVFFPYRFGAESSDALMGGEAADPLMVWTYARLKPGVSFEQAAANLEVIGRNLRAAYPQRYPDNFRMEIVALADAYTADSIRELVFILVGAVSMLLLIACSNVANLLLVRATAREQELALRASLGASRWRLVQQLLVEAVVLTVPAAAIGALLAAAGIAWVRGAIPANTLPAAMAILYSGGALAVAVGVALATTLLCALVPALRASRGNLQARLTTTGKGVAGSGRGRVRAALVAVQITLAIVLLVGAGLMIRTLVLLHRIDPGIDTAHVLTALMASPADRARTPGEHVAFVRRVIDGVRTLPGVTAVSPSLGVPLQSLSLSPVTLPGIPAGEPPRTGFELVGEDYFQALGLPLIGGRLFTLADVDGARRVVVVNEAFVAQLLGGASPIGRTATFAFVDRGALDGQSTPFEIVGIVGNARNAGLTGDIRPQAFLPYTTPSLQVDTLIVRTSGQSQGLELGLREKVWEADRGVALMNVAWLDDVIHTSALATPTFGVGLMASFAVIGLILAAIGVFSVMAYSVSLQTRDIGVQMALGATPRAVVRTIVLRGLRPIAVGLVLGVATAYGLSRLMENQVYGVATSDPGTFAAVCAVLVLVAMAACVLPARRAARVNPLVALRDR